MTELSPAAQAVLNAFRADWKDEHLKQDVKCLAAALRAAAEQVVLPKYQYADWEMADLIMREIQAVADELEAQ